MDGIGNRLAMWLFGAAAVLVCALLFGIADAAMGVDRSYPDDNAALRKLHGDQCEKPRGGKLIAEFQNTWSNLAYLVAGVFVLVRARSASGRMLGANLAILGFMSGLYHASLGHDTPQLLDVAWVYAVLCSMILKLAGIFAQTDDLGRIAWWQWVIVGGMQFVLMLVCWLAFDPPQLVAFLLLSVVLVPLLLGLLFLMVRHTGRPVPWYWWITMTALLTAFGVVIRRSMHWDSDAVFPIFVTNIAMLLMLVTIDAVRRDGNSGVGAGLLALELGVIGTVAGLGFLFRLGDGYTEAAVAKWLCHPESVLQAHAWWHVLSATALLLTYDLATQLERRGAPWTPDLPTLFPER